jgi:hypothetical protein
MQMRLKSSLQQCRTCDPTTLPASDEFSLGGCRLCIVMPLQHAYNTEMRLTWHDSASPCFPTQTALETRTLAADVHGTLQDQGEQLERINTDLDYVSPAAHAILADRRSHICSSTAQHQAAVAAAAAAAVFLPRSS